MIAGPHISYLLFQTVIKKRELGRIVFSQGADTMLSLCLRRGAVAAGGGGVCVSNSQHNAPGDNVPSW